MTHASRKMATIIVALTVLAANLAFMAGTAQATEAEPTVVRHGLLAVEVAEDGTRFVFDEAPVFDDGLPAYGNGFVTQGYIYPEGTLDGHDGVEPDGSPEFPDDVLGTWTCYGYFIGDGAQTAEGPWVMTTQVFDFSPDGVVGGTVGRDTLVTVGYETPAGQPTAVRAVVGGTGRFANVAGEVAQLTLGHNASEGVDASFEFRISGAGRGQIRPTAVPASVDGGTMRPV